MLEIIGSYIRGYVKGLVTTLMSIPLPCSYLLSYVNSLFIKLYNNDWPWGYCNTKGI